MLHCNQLFIIDLNVVLEGHIQIMHIVCGLYYYAQLDADRFMVKSLKETEDELYDLREKKCTTNER